MSSKKATLNQSLWRHGWRRPSETAYAHALIAARTAQPFIGSTPPNDSRIAASFVYYQHAPQYEYAYCFRHALIEPTMGFVMSGVATLVPESMPHYWEVGLPTWAKVAQLRLTRPVVRERAVISLREFGDNNYYHFYSDVLGKLALLARHGVCDMPIVVSARLANQRFFQDVVRCSLLRERRWIVQDRQFIAADQVWCCKPLPHARESFDFVLDQLSLPPARDMHRIFLKRRPERGRWIANATQLEAVCKRYGFVAVDADDLDLTEQIALFRSARFVVGIHGAGLINCMFRRGASLDLLELFPPESIPPHYFWLAQTFGFGYDALVGTAANQTGAFVVDPALLEARLANMVR